jgi:hypothetical protein
MPTQKLGAKPSPEMDVQLYRIIGGTANCAADPHQPPQLIGFAR